MSNNANSSISNFYLKGLLEKDKLTGLNYVDWLRNLRIVPRMENKQRAIEEPLPAAPAAGASRAIREEYEKRLTESNEAACLMLATMVPELQKGMESLGAYDMANQLKDMFQQQARQERFDNVKALSECKMAPGSSVSVHVLKMKSYIDQLERLGFPISQELATDFILSSLSSSYEPFVLNYQMNNLEKTIMELHGMLKTAESNMAKSKPAAPVLVIREGGIKKKKAAPVKGKGKGKAIQPNPKPKTKGQGKAQSDIPQSKTPEDAVCFHCKEVGHWRRTCPKYLEELKKLKANGASTSGTYMIELHSTSASNSWVLDTGCGTHICTNVQGLKRSRKVRRGELDLIMGNKQIASVDVIGNYELSFSSGLSVVLIDCCYSAEMARNIISFYALYKDGFDFGFDNGSILVYKNNVLYFKANPCHGIYETSITVRDNRSSIYNVESTQSKNGLDKLYLWHCRLGHISKKRITKLQLDGILESFDHTSNDECESCLLGKMTKAPFTGTCERGKDLLDIVHTDVCGPFRSATRHDERYFVTFIDDFSRYGYVYLIKHKSETIEVFKTFQNEVENQLNRKIKTLRSDRGGEYLSQEFQDHLRSCGIIVQLTPRTPQHNGVAERRNQTLLDMVRSMMSRTALPISFWGYALETAARVLNLVPTKKVSKTPSEIWSGKVPSLAYLKVWGCEAYVRREAQDKLESRSEMCYFVGYPTNSFGYLFYKPLENKVFVARRAWFFERELISKETSGSQIDLEEIQESTNMETDVGTSSQQQVVESIVVEPQQRVTEESDIQPAPVRRSDRVDLDEPTSYQEAMAGPKAAKWKEAMESEMQSMYDNQVWDLLDHIPIQKIVGHKWVFKKKTDMDSKVHTYKARLVAKGYTQTHGVDYDETFSPVAMLKSIRIVIAIAAFHDYEIWQMDVKTAFLNGKLFEDVYMTQPEGFVQSEHPNRVCKLQKSIYGLKQASRSWNICFDEKIKEFGFLRSEDEPYDILLMGNDIPTLQSVKTWLGKCFSMKDMGDAAYILGIKIYRDRSRRLIGLSQSTYIDKVLKKFNMQDSKKGFIPMQHGLALSKAQCPSSSSELERMSRIPYASAIGSIMYAMICTRPDVSCALSMTSQYQANPGNDHWTAVKNILKYLRRTKEMFLVYGGVEELSVKGYTDASFQTDRDDSCSQSGFVFLLNGRAVSWRSSKQSTIADSTTEAEYIAVNEAAKEAVWMKKFIGDLGVVPSIQDPIEIFCDNEGAVILAKEPSVALNLVIAKEGKGGVPRCLLTADLLEPFEEPEREFRKRNKKKSKANKVRSRALIFEMGDEAPMWTARRAAPTVPTNPITKPNLNKEILGKLLHMIKDLTFDGKNDSNPIVHMENFVDICDLFKTEVDRDDAIRLRVFPLTLIGEARAWLRSLEPSSITTWEGLRSKFLSRFFPPSKIDKLRAEIRSFQQQDGETISEAWERFKHLLNSCPSHELNKSEHVQTFYSGLAYSSRATLDSSAGGVFMYKTPTEGYKLLKDMLIHNIDWRTDKRLQIPRMAGKISTDFDPSDELAAMKNQQVKFERKIEELIKSVHALQVGCKECNGPHLTKDCPKKPMMTPEEVNYINRGDYQGRWNNNHNFIPRPPGFFAPAQQNQRSDGEPRVSIEDRIVQFMDAQKKLNDEVGSYLRNHQSTIHNLELQVGRVSQMLSERTQGELPTQTQVNPKVENVKPMLMITGEPSKKKWTDIYKKKYVETESESEPDYATDYDSEGFTVSFEHLRLKVPEASSDDEDEEDGKQGGYVEFVIPKKEDKGKEKEKEKEKEKGPDDDLIYIAPIKHDPGSYNLPISCHKFSGLALVDSGAALNMMPVGYCRKMGVKRIVPTNYQYRGVNGYMTTPLGIAEGIPIRIGKFVYYTDFVIANLPQNTEIPIILGRSFLHTAQVNTDMRNQVTSLGYGDNRIYFDPNGEPVRHLDEPYDDPSLAYTKSTNRPLLPHELGKKTEDYSNPMHKKEQLTKEPGTSKKDHRKKRGSSSRRAKK
ncbi:hypothetical protein OSB04_011044 [Centaurea solstitialis]|uniref:Uncharacterized protein n=1 Tax=Centaurea solstitialis TaxID=347529 RepID=A0AA38WL58_9ASTR|nr:hypothetical protein OSB04_011044 [Centaurea solstitialis]